MAEYRAIIRQAGLEVVEVGPPTTFLEGARGEPPARPFEPFGVTIKARKP